MFAGLPFITVDPKWDSTYQKEINRVVYLSAEEERICERDEWKTVTASYNAADQVLFFRFTLSYENADHRRCFDGPLLGYLTPRTVVQEFPLVPTLSTRPFVVTTFVPPPAPIAPPIQPSISVDTMESVFKNVVAGVKVLGLQKKHIDTIAQMLVEVGTTVRSAIDMNKNAFYETDLSRKLKNPKKRKISEISE